MSPNFLNRLMRTSESWSFKRFEKTGRIKSVVGFFPIYKETDKRDPAKAPLKKNRNLLFAKYCAKVKKCENKKNIKKKIK